MPRRPDSLGTTSRRQPFSGGSHLGETFAHAALARLGGQKLVSAPAKLTRQDSGGTDDDGVDPADDIVHLPEPGNLQLQPRGPSAEPLQAMPEATDRSPLLDLPKPPSDGIKAGRTDSGGHDNVLHYIHHADQPIPLGYMGAFGPNASAQLPADPKSKQPPRKASADGAKPSTESRKRIIDDADTTADRPKRSKGVPGEQHNGGVDPVQPSSRSETPVTEAAHASAQDKEERRKKASASRSHGTERSKKPIGSDGNRSDARPRPPMTTNTVEETISNLRRWQRHERDAVRWSLKLNTSPFAS